MPDKKYLIEIPDMPEGSGIWEADKWERNKDAFMKENPTAKVFEMGAYDAEDTNKNDQIFISMDDEESSGVWDSDKWERNKDAFMQENPTAQISRVRYQDYWGDRAAAIESRLAELDQPDQERAARLAEIGYFDDSENEANLDINLKPVSQAMKVNSVSGDVEYLDPAVEEFFANDDAYTQKQLEKNQLKAEYDTNPTVIAQREWEAKRKEAEKAYRGELKQQITEDYDANVDKNKAARGGIEIDGVPVYGPASFEAEKQDKYLAALQLLDFADRMEKGEKFWEGVGYGATKAAVDYDGKEMQQVGLVFKKLEDRGVNINKATEEQIDEALDPEDKALMLSYLEYQKAMYEADPSRAFKGGAQFGETIPFILEFIATGDIYKAGAKKTMELAGKKAIGKGFAKWIAKSAGKKIPTLMKQGVAKATTGTIKALGGTLTRTLASPTTYTKMATPDIQISEQGDVSVETHATREFFDHYIENLSEISGEGMVAGLGGAAKLLNSTKIGKMPFMKLGEWLGNKAIWQGLSKLGAQSLPIEVAEEVVGNALRYVTGVDKDALGRMFEKDEFASMLIGFAPLTVLGMGTSAAAMGAVNIGAATAQTKMRDALNPYYTEQQIDDVTGALERAKTSDEVVEALKPILVGMHDATQDEKTAVMDYAIKVAKKKAMISARNFQEMQLSDAAIRQVEDKVGRFWIENEDKSRTVRQVNLNDGRQVFVVSEPNEANEVATVEIDTGKKGMAKLTDIKEEIFNSSLESYGTRFVMADRKAKEQERMANERQVQINLVRQNLAAQKGRINLGTEGAPIMVVADAETEAGVRYVAENGSTGNLSWEAVADAMGTPIIVKTDAQLAQEEAAAIVARDAERRAARAQQDAVGTEEVTEAAEEVENAANQLDDVHIPKNEDGSVNEAAFWEQNPEAYVQWNDEQQQDGGVDSLEQITNAKNELTGLLSEAQTAQQTSDPMQRKAAKAEVQRLSEKINTLTALEQKYVEALKTPEQKRKDVEEGIKTRAKEWSDKTGVEINVVENLSQVKNAEARAAMAAGQKVFAWAESGKTYMYLPAIESVEQLDEKFAHEAVAHVGLRSFLGDGYDALLDRVWNSMSDTAKRRYANYGTVRGDQRSAADEYLAHIAEKMGADVASMQEFNEEEKSVWQSIVDFVKEAFGKIFGNSATISEEEITDLIRSSYQNLAQQTAATDEATEQQRSAINSLMDALTPEEAVEVAENDYQIASDALKELMANQPKVEKGESSASYIERKKAYNESLREAQAKADAARTIADEVKRMTAPAPAQVSEVQPEAEQETMEIPEVVDNIEETQQSDGTFRLSVVTYNDWTDNLGIQHKGTRSMVVERMAAMDFTSAEINDMTRKMDTIYEYMEKLRSLTNEDGSVRFDEFNAWAETTPMYKQVGRDIVKAITSLVSNGDYPINMELTTDCIKREAYTMLLNTLIKRGADLSQMGPGEIVTIQKMMKQYGIETACALCFVEGKRLQIVNWASQIVEDWNDALVEAGVETEEHFGFGKDGDAFIPAEEWRTHENKAEVAKVMRQLDEIDLLFRGIDPAQFKRQKAKNKRVVEKYKKEKAEAWAKKTKKPISQWKPTDKQEAEIKKMAKEGLAPTYVNENMEEYRNAFNAMRNEWLEKNPGKDPLSFTPTKKQWEALGKIRNRQIDTVKAKMVRLIMEYPEMRKKMTLNDLLGSKGLMEIRQQHGQAYADLYSIILQRFGTGTPKPVQDAVPYDGELMTLSESAFKKANEIGGARLFSFSDFDITKVFDYMQMFFDLEANRQMLQSYTKEVAAVLIFGRSNAKFNISTLANAYVPQEVLDEYAKASEGKQREMRHKWAEYAGLQVDEAGNITGINFSDEHSVSPAFAQQIFHDETRNKDCGAIMVGASVNHAIYSAAQAWIRMVIPFHLSGMPKAAQDKTDVKWYFDNTPYQSTRKKTSEGWAKISSSEDTFKFYDDMNKPGWNMRDKAKQYLAWCAEKGFRPKFDWGINSDYYRAFCEEMGYAPDQKIIDTMDADTTDGVWNQYYKFLTDFTAYKPVFNEQGEMIDEIPSPQLPVQSNFDFSELEREVLFEGEDSMLGHREENIQKAHRHMDALAAQVVPYLNGEITEEDMGLKDNVFYNSHADAERYLEALAERQEKELGRTMFSVESRTEEQREQLFDAAKKEFGTTDNFNVAGYMLPDGSLLDFSEEGAPANQRTLDHREIEGIIMDEGREYDNRWQYLADFMNEGAIRLLPEYAGINLMHAPTAEQRKRLFDFIYKYNGEVILEIADDRLNNVAYVEYDRRTSPSRIFRDIDGYFKEGIVPQQNTMFSVEDAKDTVEGMFAEAVSGKFTGKPKTIGVLTEEGKAYLESISGIEFKDRVTFVLNSSDLNHIYKEHFGENEKDTGSNIPLNIDDIRNIVDVMSNPERVLYLGDDNGKRFAFLAPAADGAYNLVEVYTTKRGNLSSKTFYKTKKGVSHRAMILEKESGHSTSETNGAALSATNVPKLFDIAISEEDYNRFVAIPEQDAEHLTARYSAEERRIINELFPGAIQEETRFSAEEAAPDDYTRFSVVTDPALIEELENGPKIKVYRAMQLIDGELYPPMSAKVEGKLRKPIKLGQWEQAEERPDLIDSKGNFKLDKANKASVPARYNPYFHTSRTPLNDQFSSAQSRPNLVTVEVEIPESELTSGYKADKAKDSVGEKEWKAGVIQGKLSGTRKVILSRWDKPVRIVPDSEVAAEIVKMFDGKDITMPSNVVTPSLRAELEKLGVPFVETDNNGKPVVKKNSLLDVIKTLYTKGKDIANKLYQRSFFEVVETPAFMKEYGLTGNKFTVRYGVIARHFGKDGSHDLSEKDWEQLPSALQNPFAITKIKEEDKAFRIYTSLKTAQGEYVVVGVDVKNAGRDLEVNAISTVFGRRSNANLTQNEEVIYKSKDITPEQSSLLERPNSSQYPTEQELSDNKDSDNSENSNTLFSVDTETEIKAIKGLSILDSMNISLEQEMVITREAIDAERKRIAELNKRLGDKDLPVLKKQIENAEDRLKTYLRQMEILQDVEDKLIKVELVEPDVRAQMANLEPQNAFEYLSELLTMHLTPIVQTKVVDADGKETIVRQGGKKKGVMLTPETLEKELGYSKSDWKGISYIVSESEGMSLDAIAEMIEQDFDASHIFGSMNTMEIKDVIIDFLQSMSSYTEIRDYIKNERERMAKEEADEIVESGKQKVLQQNADAADTLMDRIRAINGNLQQLRMMAAAQREYDKQTVKAITDLANELLTDGALSDMTRGEIKRLLSVIKDATGKSDLTVSVDRLMDIMIGNQLRYGKNRFEEYLKIRGKKVDARGVEVRGALDVEGQQVMDAVREGITLDMDRIQDRISAAEDKLFDTSKTISRNAEHELAGLEIAKQYIENVKESESEEKDLRKELKDAKEQYEAGIMDKTSYKEFVKATHDAIRENRMQRVMAYESLLSEMADMIKNSILKAGQLREAEKARVERIQHFANSDMQGMPADEHKVKDSAFWNNPIVRFLLKPLATFDQMLRHFAPKSRSGEGYLWNHFMGGWLRATENEYKGIQAAHDKLDAKVRSVFGNSAKKWSDLFAIERKLPKAEIRFWDAGEIKEFEVTQGNLLYIYMVNKMTDGKMKLRKMGISEEDVADMTRELDPRFVELADWLQEDFLPGLREKYNEVHERLFGAPMAAIDNYFPIRVLANARTREVDVNIEESNAKPSTITGNIMKRTRNSLALDILGSDAFDVILGHIEDMEKWAAFSEWNKDLNTLLSYKKFRNRVQNMSGIYGAGSVVWNNFRSVAEIAAGVYKPATKADSVDKTIMNIAKGVTGAKISFRVYTAFKQLLSWPAFISDANPVILAKNMVNPAKAWNWAMDNLPLFEKRWKSRQAGDSRLMQTDADWKLWKNKAVEIAGRLGMTPNALVDAVTVAIGARSVYETRVKQYLDYGYDQEKAEEKAKRDATVAFNESQQSNESAFLSQIQMDRTVASVVLTVFRNSSMGYQRMYVDALRNITRMTKKGYKTESIEYMKKQMLRDGLAEADADRAANRIYNRSFVKNAVQALTFGFIVQLAWNLGPYLPYIFGGDDDDKKKEMATDAAVRALVGGPVEGMSGGSVLSNVLGNIAMGEKLSEVNGVQLPLSSDVENLFKLFGKDNVRAVNEIFNIVIQSGIGVNPQTITDAVVAIVDACNGDLGTATEAALCLMRILQVPQSQLEDLYLDEIDFSADDALDLTIREFAERYAKYKVSRSAPLTKWMYTDEKEKEREETFIKRFTSEAEELKRTRGNEEAKAFYQYYDNEYADVAESLRDLKRRAKDAEGAEVKAISKEADEFVKTEEFKRYNDLVGDIKAYEAYKKLLKDVTDPETRKEYEKEMLKHRRNVVNKINGYETEIE